MRAAAHKLSARSKAQRRHCYVYTGEGRLEGPLTVPETERRAARAAGERRVQTVTTWTTAGAVDGAAVLSVLLANGTVSAATRSTVPSQTNNQVDTGTEQTGGGQQLQAPDFLPGSTGGGGRHAATGGS